MLKINNFNIFYTTVNINMQNKEKLNQIIISLNNYNNQRKELNTNFEDSKCFSIKL